MASPTGILAYGYHLGGNNEGWKLQGVGEFGELPDLDWYRNESEEEPQEDFSSSAEHRLLTLLAGFTETYSASDGAGYYKRKEEAEARLGIKLLTYGDLQHDTGGYILSAHSLRADDYGVCAVTIRDFTPAQYAAWEARLEQALAALTLRPTQRQPTWLLTSTYG